MMSAPNYSKYLTREAAARKPSPIRALMPLLKVPGMISLGAGLPNPATFPISGMRFDVSDPTCSSGEGSMELELSPDEVSAALQYSETKGMPVLVEQLASLMERTHGENVSEVEVERALAVTTGSQDGLTKAFASILGEGDSLLVEDPTYSGALAYLQPAGVDMVPIPVDGEGLDPDSLARVLDEWPEEKPKPKALYTIVTGQNPSGATTPLERKEAIYQLACQHDFLILEDDPYYFLTHDGHDPAPSFLSIDSGSRTLRFDSLSKVFSSGIRIGWVTGPEPLVQAIILHAQATSLHSSGLSQALVAKILQSWGPPAFDAHIASVRSFYSQRAQAFEQAAQRHLSGLAEWSTPTAGMFFWFKISGIEDSFALIKEKALEAKVLLVPGSAFSPLGLPSPYVRASFSVADPDLYDEALSRLATLIRDAHASQSQSQSQSE